MKSRATRSTWSPFAAAVLAAVAMTCGCGEDLARSEVAAPRRDAFVHARQRTELALDRVSITSSRGDDGGAKLSADRVVLRKRTGLGGFLTYYDVLEVVMTRAGLTIDENPGGRPGFSRLVEHLRRSLPPDVLIAALGRGSGPASSRVTRVLFEGLSVRVAAAESDILLLSSKHARLGLDSDTLVLDGGFELSLAGGNDLIAPVAAISQEQEGLLLPMGYSTSDARVDHTAFLVVDPDGRLARQPVVPAMVYEDRIDSAERAVLAHFQRRARGNLAGLLFAFLSHSGAASQAEGGRPFSVLSLSGTDQSDRSGALPARR